MISLMLYNIVKSAPRRYYLADGGVPGPSDRQRRRAVALFAAMASVFLGVSGTARETKILKNHNYRISVGLFASHGIFDNHIST